MARRPTPTDPPPTPDVPAQVQAQPVIAPSIPGGRPQMADIARLAGVSTSTVSRALAGSALVNQETRERIAEIARALNYSINVGAQNLRLKQNRTVAVIVPYHAPTRQSLTDPFFLSLIGSLADALTGRGHDMLLGRVDADHLDLAAQAWRSGRALGVVIVGQWQQHAQLNAMALQRVPFVVWGGRLPDQEYATVGSDNVGGGELATAHLLAQGCRRVLFMGDPEMPEVGQRLQGWQAAHQRAGVAVDPALIRRVPFVSAEIEAEVLAMAAQGLDYDGLFASSDWMAMTAIATLRRLGRSVPQHVRVVGYDDIALAGHLEPSLSTVRQPIAEAGEQLVELLLRSSAGQGGNGAPTMADSRLLATELVVRQSSSGAHG